MAGRTNAPDDLMRIARIVEKMVCSIGILTYQVMVLEGWHSEEDIERARAACRLEPESMSEPVMLRLDLPSDEIVLHALAEASSGGRPVSATEVARLLFRGEQGHSEVVRVGHALGRLSRDGRVVRHGETCNYGKHGGGTYVACRRSLMKGGDDDA